MKRLVEFSAPCGEHVLVEVEDVGRALVTRGIAPGDLIEKANDSFEDAIGRAQPAIEAVIHRLRQVSDAPDEVQVEFGLNLHAETGAFIASASATANFTVSLTWRNTPPPAPATPRSDE